MKATKLFFRSKSAFQNAITYVMKLRSKHKAIITRSWIWHCILHFWRTHHSDKCCKIYSPEHEIYGIDISGVVYAWHMQLGLFQVLLKFIVLTRRRWLACFSDWSRLSRSTVFWLETEGGGVYAVTLPCRPGSIIKEVAKVSSTLTAGCLHSMHAVWKIISLRYRLLIDQIEKGRPSWSWVKLLIRREERGTADGTMVGSLLFVICIFSCESTFCAFFLSNMVLHWSQAFPQLFLGEGFGPCLLATTRSWGKPASLQFYRLALADQMQKIEPGHGWSWCCWDKR